MTVFSCLLKMRIRAQLLSGCMFQDEPASRFQQFVLKNQGVYFSGPFQIKWRIGKNHIIGIRTICQETKNIIFDYLHTGGLQSLYGIGDEANTLPVCINGRDAGAVS